MDYVLTEYERAGMVICFGYCLKAWINNDLDNTTTKLCALAFVAGVRAMHEDITDEEADKYIDTFNNVIDNVASSIKDLVFH